MRQRLLLVKPPERTDFSFGAFSLATLAAPLVGKIDVRVLDATEVPCEEAARRVWAADPDVVGVTVMGVGSIPAACRFISALARRSSSKRTTILAGGHGATAAPLPILEAGCDAIVMGEGEATLERILERGVSADETGLATLRDGQVQVGPAQRLIEPLDLLPGPAWEIISASAEGTFLLETSRGCPHACAFCEATRFHGRRWRPHGSEWVAREVARLVEEHEAWVILIADDNFAASSSRLLEICGRLAAGPLPATFLASVRADDLLRDSSIIPALAAANVFRVTVGVETLESGPATAVGKAIPIETYQEAFARLAENGIFSLASYIVGLPGESKDPRRLLKLALDSGCDAAIFVPFLPMPGTPLGSPGGALHFEPTVDDRVRASALTSAFYGPSVLGRLGAAARSGGIRGLMARATLKRRASGECGAPKASVKRRSS